MIPLQRFERQRGATAVIVAIMLTVLCGFLALVMNSGHIMAVKGQLQNATDSAALAGVRELNGTEAGVTAARTVAEHYSGLHFTDRIPVDIGDADVVIGAWDFTKPRADAFTPITGLTATDLAKANAVLVNAGREASRKNALDVAMGGLLGKKQTDVRASSVAVNGGPGKNGCGLMPLAFSSCAVKDEAGNLKCDATLTFNKDGADNMGFTNLLPTSGVTPPVMNDILDGKSCPTVSVGDSVWVSNGADLKHTLDHFRPHVNDPVLVPIVEIPDCKFVSSGVGGTVTGFMTITITQVNDPPVNSIELKIDCQKSPVETVAGGGNYGTTATKPQLVR